MADYSKKGHYYIDEPRFELKLLTPLLPNAATILDMGAGNGNNIVPLLESGHTVTAVEPNPAAIKTLQRLHEKYPDSLTIVEASLDTYKPKQKFDVIMCCMVVHFMKDHESGIKAIRDIQSWTKPGGLNLLTSYTNVQALPNEYSFLLMPHELSELYAGWKAHWSQESYRLTLGRIRNPKDALRLVLGKRGFKAARIIVQK
jgi:2-polyprenyl-3-methyl-5-hydroxy-6-metoxy-1,4-benzoquinol methylase